ncbi:MAG: hypothetical protein AB1705_04500 [Verrucomicrobiota bacterium]
MGALLGAITYSLTLAGSWQHYVTKHPPGAAAAPADHGPGPSWNFQNPEIELLVAELRKEKEHLGAREAQLNELAARLAAERQELNLATQRVHQLQLQFDNNVTRIRDEETANLKKMAKTYAAMTPDSVARIFKELDDVVVVKILRFMKETETAPILEVLARQGENETRRAAAIAEKLRLSMPDSPKPKS